MSTTSDAVVYNPYAYEIHEDPYPIYERLREEARFLPRNHGTTRLC